MKKYKFFNFKVFTIFISLLTFIGIFNVNFIDLNNKNKTNNIDQEVGNIITQANGQQVYGEDSDQIYEASSGTLVDQDLDGYADTIYMWGDNEYGQLGINNQVDQFVSSPQKIDTFTYGTGGFYDLETSGTHSGVVFDSDNNGKSDQLYLWGDNDYQQLAVDKNITSKSAIPILVDFNWAGDIIELELSNNYSGVTVDSNYDGYADTLYMWGNNQDGQIGDGNKENTILEPTLITPKGQSNWGGNIIDFETEGNHTGIIIDTDLDGYADTLYMWGNNDYGQIGNGERNLDVTTPTIIIPKDSSSWEGNLIDLELGSYHSGAAVDSNYDGYADTLYMWGDNYFNQLGNLQLDSDTLLPLISFGPDQNWGGDITSFSLSGLNSSVAIDTDDDHLGDKIYLWGDNNYGQIGNNSKTEGNNNKGEVSIPTSPLNQSGEEFDLNGNVINLDLSGNSSSVLIDTNNDGLGDNLYVWGNNDYGQLGIGTIGEDLLTPDQNDFNLKNFKLQDYQIYNQNDHQMWVDITLNDPSDIFNQNNIPTLKLQDQNNIYSTTYIDSNSNPEDDFYSFKINDLKTGVQYDFDQILINDQNNDFSIDKIFNIGENKISNDYQIIDANIFEKNISSTEVLVNLTIDNRIRFDISNFTEQQLQVRINYQDQNGSYQEVTEINQNQQILLQDLEPQENYLITNIDYFYEDNNYKYSLNDLNLSFSTDNETPVFYDLNNTFSIDSVQQESLKFTVEIDNIVFDQDGSVKNIENVVLVDNNNDVYESQYVQDSWVEDQDNLKLDNTVQRGYATFEITDLNEKTNYNFVGISFYDDGTGAQMFAEPQIIQTDKYINYILITSIIVGLLLLLLILVTAIYIYKKYYHAKKEVEITQDLEIFTKTE
ncbi:/ / Regulator of chromosome condensation (RCC1) repeat protein / 323167:325821 Forward [Candidatus Hepatoplasma crinochetorum]|uniref:/ / Regulator of chromosome condensation (RCC1) repeat protein / 323167:325821 Forward n=1 Tax=Candidatus Hepatoplasma crinochetorum TaxID=295596 RepID=A0A0G7ZN01_9MOLU|nr:/ / Regulator of chromosome condensation (RCC1) repeat protein / 323167:325821 Forward [Candidatus Hepatoplasma crinochetorum]